MGRLNLLAFFIVFVTFSIAENSSLAADFAVLLFLITPTICQRLNGKFIFIIKTIGLVLYIILGQPALLVLTYLLLIQYSHFNSIVPIGVLIVTKELSEKITTLEGLFSSQFITSMVTMLPSIVALLIICKNKIKLKQIILILAVSGLIYFFILNSLIDVNLITNEAIRIFFTLALVSAVIHERDNYFERKPDIKKSIRISLLILIGFSCSLLILQSKEPIKTIIFDEQHGDWASTKLSLAPNDYGRGTTYSWRAISNFLESKGYEIIKSEDDKILSKLDENALLVIKMPLDQIDEKYRIEVLSWVSGGGRLLLVSDHTDLFDTTQNLNKFLQTTGFEISASAVYDRAGMPPIERYKSLILSSDYFKDSSHRYLTGTSFKQVPFFSYTEKSYGMSFAEDAVYFNTNRFGYFYPNYSMAYGKHAAVSNLKYNKGEISIWLDSTHWSTFAAYQSQYQSVFLETIKNLENNYRIELYEKFLLFTIIALFFINFRIFNFIGFAFLSISVGGMLAIYIFSNSYLTNHSKNPNALVQAYVGEGFDTELLPTLVTSNQNNFARALTSLQKWGVITLSNNDKLSRNETAKNLLIINFNGERLPNPSDIIKLVKNGTHITILTSDELLLTKKHKRWIADLGFKITEERRIVAKRSPESDALERALPRLGREILIHVEPSLNSIWSNYESSQYGDIFVIKENINEQKRSLGSLLICGCSKDFSDAAMGDVWDGILTDEVSSKLERILAKSVIRDGLINSWEHDFLVWLPFEITRQPARDKFVPENYYVIKNGKIEAEGVVSINQPMTKSALSMSLSENPDAYLATLRVQLSKFLASCQSLPGVNYCDKTFFDNKLNEWFVVTEINKNNVKYELIHEDRLGQNRINLNIIFYTK